MDQLKEQLFPAEFILDYLQKDTGKKRFLSYVLFRFFSFTGKEVPGFPLLLKENLSCPFTPEAFSVVADYLMEDYYFSPSLAAGTFDSLYLYAAISLVAWGTPEEHAFLDRQLAAFCPVAVSLSYADIPQNSSLPLHNAGDFYGALYLAAAHNPSCLPGLLPRFADAYQKDYHFTCEDFILFDFMDEYFEQKNCRLHPSFTELVDTLVAATLNYYNTDFGSLLEKEIANNLQGTSSRFAGLKRFGAVSLPHPANPDRACHMLAELFRYAAVYELRNNLFDFHLDDDKLITLENWKENLRWHYVQYANVYEMALDSFHAAILSNALLKKDFIENLSRL